MFQEIKKRPQRPLFLYHMNITWGQVHRIFYL